MSWAISRLLLSSITIWVVLNLGAQILDRTGVRRRRLRRARLCPGILPHDVGDGAELSFLGRRDLQSFMQARDTGLDICGCAGGWGWAWRSKTSGGTPADVI
jgi:hypothetical protein